MSEYTSKKIHIKRNQDADHKEHTCQVHNPPEQLRPTRSKQMKTALIIIIIIVRTLLLVSRTERGLRTSRAGSLISVRPRPGRQKPIKTSPFF